MVSMHTSPTAPPGIADAGGMNVAMLATARELALRGVEVDLITRATRAPTTTQLGPGVTLHELPAGPSGELSKDELPDVADGFGEAVARLAGRDSVPYDVIHAHYWLSGIATLPVALELGIPFVQAFHTLGAMKNAATGDAAEPERRVRSEMFLANQADAVIAGSSAEAASLIDLVRAPAERVWVIPPGVDLELFAPGRARWVTDGRPIVAMVGRVQPLKGQDLAIRAVAALGRDVQLVIAGEATPGDEEYAASLRRMGGDVRFVGALDREALAGLLAAASVTLVPSHSETFGLVALESAASGTPVVASRVAGLVESVAEGESGVLVDSREPEDWARAIAGVLDEPGRYAASAREHAERFSWATAAASLLGVYASLLRRRP